MTTALARDLPLTTGGGTPEHEAVVAMNDPYLLALRKVDQIVARHGFDVDIVRHPVAVVYLVGQLEFELVVGGVAQWLTNRSGRYAVSTILGLREIGADACAGIVERIVATLGPEPRLDDDEWRAEFVRHSPESVHAAWRGLADELLDWPDDVDVLLRRYVTEHEAVFA